MRRRRRRRPARRARGNPVAVGALGPAETGRRPAGLSPLSAPRPRRARARVCLLRVHADAPLVADGAPPPTTTATLVGADGADGTTTTTGGIIGGGGGSIGSVGATSTATSRDPARLLRLLRLLMRAREVHPAGHPG